MLADTFLPFSEQRRSSRTAMSGSRNRAGKIGVHQNLDTEKGGANVSADHKKGDGSLLRDTFPFGGPYFLLLFSPHSYDFLADS